MGDATVRLETAVFGLKPKPPQTSPEVEAAVERWRLARRSGNRVEARRMYDELEKVRRRVL